MNSGRRFRIPFFFVLIVLSAHHVRGEIFFGGPIQFKGYIEDRKFVGETCDISAHADKFVISSKIAERMFTIPVREKSLLDVVFNIEHSATAVMLSGEPWKKPIEVLATVSNSGEVRMREFGPYQMTKKYGWPIELGAVSDDGKLVLAKCGHLLPEKNGVRKVRHCWLILSVSEDVVKVVEAKAAIHRWTEYAEQRKRHPAKALDNGSPNKN